MGGGASSSVHNAPGRADAAALGRAAHLSRPITLAVERTLPVLAALAPLLPDGGVRRGGVTAVEGAGCTSLALAFTAAASATGSWVAGVGLGSLGLAAAADLGVALERLVLVADPAADVRAEVLATLVDSFDIVVVGDGGHPVRTTGVHRRLQARTRERGGVVVAVGGTAGFEPDLRLRVTATGWDGLEPGAGHLRARRVVVEASGRRSAVRPRRVELWLPAADGCVRPVEGPSVAPVVGAPGGAHSGPAALAG